VSFHAIDSWWWPLVFILLAGWLATDGWRFLGVYLGGRIREDSDILVLVRSVATALVAAVISSLVVSPSGALADVPMFIRIGAAAAGFAIYLATGRRLVPGVLGGELALIAGMIVTG
jgi:hypothetical protein